VGVISSEELVLVGVISTEALFTSHMGVIVGVTVGAIVGVIIIVRRGKTFDTSHTSPFSRGASG